jgi:hypothetical protein
MTFLVQEVVREPSGKRGRKSAAQKLLEEQLRNQRRQTSAEIVNLDTLDPAECVKGIKTVKGYVTAIVDLWEKQRQYENNLHPHPRTRAVKTFLERLEIAQARGKEERLEDRGRDTDGFTVFHFFNSYYI